MTDARYTILLPLRSVNTSVLGALDFQDKAYTQIQYYSSKSGVYVGISFI